MLKLELRTHDIEVEPAPRYASDAEIALAQQLRHQLEERYFGSAGGQPSRPEEVH